MYNRALYNRVPYNRATGFTFEWLSTVFAETDASSALFVIRYLGGTATALAQSDGTIIRLRLLAAVADADSTAYGTYVRIRFFSSSADAISFASGSGVSTYGSVTFVLEGVHMLPGDELVIDTEHMTVTLNGVNIVDRITDSSAFFHLMSGVNQLTVEGGTQADIRILWKDRWL